MEKEENKKIADESERINFDFFYAAHFHLIFSGVQRLRIDYEFLKYENLIIKKNEVKVRTNQIIPQ